MPFSTPETLQQDGKSNSVETLQQNEILRFIEEGIGARGWSGSGNDSSDAGTRESCDHG